MTVYLDTYQLGDLAIYDARPVLGTDGYHYRVSSLVKTISIHHADTVALSATATMDSEIARLQQVERFHRQSRRWPGIAYSFYGFASGRFYYVGDFNRTRYTVGGDNNLETIAVCLDGSFMVSPPPSSQLAGAASVVAALRQVFPQELAVVPHKYYGGTSCPGDTWDDWKDVFDVAPLDPRSSEEVQLDVLWGLSAYLPAEQAAQQQAAIIALKTDLGLE